MRQPRDEARLDEAAPRKAEMVQVLLPDRDEPTHELEAHVEMAHRLAALKGLAFGGAVSETQAAAGAYFVPLDTLVGADTRGALGICTEHDLFGGVVPHGFVATKAITHPLVSSEAARPQGWSEAFPRAVQKAVLRGYTAFSEKDARKAALRLLEAGSVRVKPVMARGGTGQFVLHTPAEAEQLLGTAESSAGVVLEENLSEPVTYSVGQVRVAEFTVSYYGTQAVTRNNGGSEVYGGSELIVVRGGLEALAKLDMPEAARVAVQLAGVYDAAADACFPGLIASRRNYDVARGRAEGGSWRSGVLEQSWRIGGASPAEILAIEAFRTDPALATIRATTVEAYGKAAQAPEGAVVFYHGQDEELGPILKYSTVEPL